VSTGSRTDGEIDRGKDSYRSSDAQAGVVIVLANHKGGVTKTTSTANLGAMLAEAGRRVLLVDCDPQANLSEAFGWGPERLGERLEDMLVVPDAASRFRPPAAVSLSVAPHLAWRERLRIIPCTDALADIAVDLPAALGAGYATRLAEVLEPQRRQVRRLSWISRESGSVRLTAPSGNSGGVCGLGCLPIRLPSVSRPVI
jgi:hypothetical protein